MTPSTAAIAPDCDTIPMPGRPARGVTGSSTKVSGTPSTKLMRPRQFGPSTTMSASRAIWAIARCSASPDSPPSAKPAEKMIAAPTRRSARARTVSSTAARGMASTATSMPSGSASTEGRQARPAISARRGLIRWIGPAYPARVRFARTEEPSAPGLSDAPTIATDRGRSRRARLGMTRLSLAAQAMRAGSSGWVGDCGSGCRRAGRPPPPRCPPGRSRQVLCLDRS